MLRICALLVVLTIPAILAVDVDDDEGNSGLTWASGPAISRAAATVTSPIALQTVQTTSTDSAVGSDGTITRTVQRTETVSSEAESGLDGGSEAEGSNNLQEESTAYGKGRGRGRKCG